MIKTTEKILLAVLVVVFIGMTSAFIAALGSDKAPEQKQAVKVIYSNDLDETESEDFDQDIDDEAEIPATGTVLERASTAALEYVGQGRVTDSEVGDEDGYYEIEVTLDNGREADVHLDENFNVVSVEYD